MASSARIDFAPVSPVTSWTVDSVLAARDAHRAAQFSLSSGLASVLRTDDACYAALGQRLSPVAGLPREVTGGNARIRAEVEAMRTRNDLAPRIGSSFTAPVAFPDADLLEGTLLCGFQVAQMIWTPSEDGRRVNFALDPWPCSRLYWDSYRRELKALTLDQGMVTVVHGDGTWIIVQQRNADPWDMGAIIPLSSCWASRAYGWRDLNQSSETLGMSKIVANLPQGVDAASDEGIAFLDAAQGLYRPRSGALVPFGAEIKYLQDTGGGWQIHREVISGRDKAIARILLGSDGTTQVSGGDYKRSQYLWGVRQDMVEEGLRWLSEAYAAALGVWAMRNFGRDLGLEVHWLMPDPDQDARREALGEAVQAYCAAIQAYSETHEVTQEFADALADSFGVPRAPLRVTPAAAPAEQGAPQLSVVPGGV